MDQTKEISECAYYIWLREGCPDGKALEHWLRAEAEVAARSVENTSVVPGGDEGKAAEQGKNRRKTATAASARGVT